MLAVLAVPVPVPGAGPAAAAALLAVLRVPRATF
jgi:hypothetical protein